MTTPPRGIFLDIGANVGTTSIYMQKRLNNNQIYAFEPVRENYNLLKANCFLNNSDSIIAENIGISDSEFTAVMKTDPNNMASSRLEKNVLSEYASYYSGNEKARFTTLDIYAKDNGIKIENVKGVWIDVEGSEPSVFLGSKDFFRKCNAPVYVEYNPKIYERNGEYDLFLELLMDIYTSFICWEDYQNGSKARRDIKELKFVKDEMKNVFCNLLLLKS